MWDVAGRLAGRQAGGRAGRQAGRNEGGGYPNTLCSCRQPGRLGCLQVLLRAPPAPPGADFVLFDQFWVGTGGRQLPAPGQGGWLLLATGLLLR